MVEKYYYRRPCNRCGALFQPTGKFQRICEKCNPGADPKLNIKKKYFKAKEQLDLIRSNATLSNWKILSHAYKLGKQIWGSRFTRQRLVYDMDMPLTTVLRCLSLDRANKKSWKAVDDGKISAFQLAMICSLKSKTYQDEIVKMVIKDKLSTFQIKTLKIDNLKDIQLEKLRLATEKGFSRKISAAISLKNWIDRGNLLLLMDKKYLSEDKVEEIEKELKNLNDKIDRYLE